MAGNPGPSKSEFGQRAHPCCDFSRNTNKYKRCLDCVYKFKAREFIIRDEMIGQQHSFYLLRTHYYQRDDDVLTKE